jgi:hypothetical protein
MVKIYSFAPKEYVYLACPPIFVLATTIIIYVESTKSLRDEKIGVITPGLVHDLGTRPALYIAMIENQSRRCLEVPGAEVGYKHDTRCVKNMGEQTIVVHTYTPALQKTT